MPSAVARACHRTYHRTCHRTCWHHTTGPTCHVSLAGPARAAAHIPLRLFYNDVYTFPLPDKHRFPMEKYRLVRQQLQRDLEHKGLASFSTSPLATVSELETVHCPQYINRFTTGQLDTMENRRIGFPWSPAGVDRALSSVGGTVAAARYTIHLALHTWLTCTWLGCVTSRPPMLHLRCGCTCLQA